MTAAGTGGVPRVQPGATQAEMLLSHWKKNKKALRVLGEVEEDEVGGEVNRMEERAGKITERS